MSNVLVMPWAIPVICGCLVGIVAIIANTLSSLIKSNAETSLKKRMVGQGFTVADIERVIRSTARACPKCGSEYPEENYMPAKPPKQHARAI